MHAALLALHITTLTISMVALAAFSVLSLAGRRISRVVRSSVTAATVIGVAIGFGLLLGHPLGAQCLGLTAYSAVYALVYGLVSRRQARLAAE